MIKKSLGITLLFVFSLFNVKSDTLHIKNENDFLVGKTIKKILGYNQKELSIQLESGGERAVALENIDTLINNGVRYLPIDVAVGNKKYLVLARLYYKGELSLLETRIDDHGKVQVLLKNGSSIALFESNLKTTLLTLTEGCLDENAEISSNTIIQKLDEYHLCVNKKSQTYLVKAQLEFNLGLEIGSNIPMGGAFEYSKLTPDALVLSSKPEPPTLEQLPNKRIVYTPKIVYSMHVSGMFNGFYFSPGFRVRDYDLEIFDFNMVPLSRPETEGDIFLSIRSLDIGFRAGYVFNHKRNFQPFVHYAYYSSSNGAVELSKQQRGYDSFNDDRLVILSTDLFYSTLPKSINSGIIGFQYRLNRLLVKVAFSQDFISGESVLEGPAVLRRADSNQSIDDAQRIIGRERAYFDISNSSLSFELVYRLINRKPIYSKYKF